MALSALTEAVRLNKLTPEALHNGEFEVSAILPSKEEQVGFALAQFVVEMDELLINLNLVIGDLRRLGNSPRSFSHPDDRYLLLIRTYFYEFGRADDLYNKLMAALVKAGFMRREHASELRRMFYEKHRQMFEIRNVNTHLQLVIPKDSQTLLMVGALEGDGRWQMVDPKTNEPMSVQGELRKVCPARAEGFTRAARSLRNMVEGMIFHLDKPVLRPATRKKLERARRRRAKDRNPSVQLRLQLRIS
jgi:hypothetical protein